MAEIEFCAEIRNETDHAYLAFDGINEVWLPKSQVKMREIKWPDFEITVPEWLAKKKGII
jgi:hypothetical protein